MMEWQVYWRGYDREGATVGLFVVARCFKGWHGGKLVLMVAVAGW